MIDPRSWSVPQLVCAGLGLTIVAALVFAATTSATAFGAYNYGWDGSADLREVAAEEERDVEILQDTSAYEQLSGNDTIAVILGPDETYDADSASRIRSYVRRGGTVLIATDFGAAGNDLLASLNATVRVDGGLVRDERNHGASPAFPIATNVSIGSGQVSRLALNYPSALTGTQSETVSVLAQTSAYAYIDRNRNDELDESEQLQAYPVMAREPVGNGSVIAVSDPSLFINTMLDREDNRAAATALFDSSERVWFDYTHTGGIPPLRQIVLLIRSSQLAGFAFGVSAIGITAAMIYTGPRLLTRLQRRYRRESVATPGLSEQEIVEVVAEAHPEWDRERVRRIAERLATQDTTND